MKQIKNKSDTLSRIRETYITSDCSLTAAAKAHNSNFPSVSKAFRAENWTQLRDDWRKAHGLPPARPPRRYYDWTAIRAEYISGDESLSQLAEKYGYPFKSVTIRAWRDHWYDDRLKFRADLGDNTAAESLRHLHARRANGIDWNAIRNDYLSSVMSLDELADAHNVSRSAVGVHCAREHWEQLRKNALAEKLDQTLQRLLSTQAETICELLPTVNLSSHLLNATVHTLLNTPGLKLNEQLAVSRILKNLEPVQRVLTGRLTPSEQLRRSELEKNTDDQTFHVELSPELNDLAQ